MKKYVFIALLCGMLFASGCQKTERVKTASDTSMFVVIEETMSWRVVYHRETKVMYAVSCGGNNGGDFTLLVDRFGKPMIYNEVSE